MTRQMSRWIVRAVVCITMCVQTASFAGPYAPPGDAFLRHDIEMLADAGVIDIPVMTWPMSWGDVSRAISGKKINDQTPLSVVSALTRVRRRARDETSPGELRFGFGAAVGDNPRRLRLFEDTPRADGQITGAAEYAGDRFFGRAQLTFAANPDDDREFRPDGSYVAVALGNTIISAGWQEKWWGPGFDGALALSTNARPVPGIMINRNFSDPFKTRWLSWMGPWNASFFVGEMEAARGIPNARLAGGRIVIRPFPSLEFGVTRTAQWGGEGRPDSLDTFFNLLLGRDNVGDDALTRDNEPGNQLAGFDWRWRVMGGTRPVVVYGQMIGEDEAGGFPSRYLGQFGVSVSSPFGERGDQVRVHAEFSDTTCQFYESSKLFNCAYNSSLYPSGYRYRGRPIGHSSDNDTRQFALGASLFRTSGERFSASVRYSQLNRGGGRDDNNALSPLPSDLINAELTHERELFDARLTIGVGVDQADSDDGGLDQTDVRAFLQWNRTL